MTRVIHVELEPDDICGRRSRAMCGVVVESERRTAERREEEA